MFTPTAFLLLIGVVEGVSPTLEEASQTLRATGWATFEALPDPGTAGAGLSYSVRTAGVIRNTGGPLLIDVFEGSRMQAH